MITVAIGLVLILVISVSFAAINMRFSAPGSARIDFGYGEIDRTLAGERYYFRVYADAFDGCYVKTSLLVNNVVKKSAISSGTKTRADYSLIKNNFDVYSGNCVGGRK